MPARRAQHGKKEANVCWLGKHAVSHHQLAVQFRRQSVRKSVRTDIVVLLEQTKQVCQCTLRSDSGKGDTEEQARKNVEAKRDVDDAADVGDMILTIPEIPWDRFENELARTKRGDSRL